MPPRYDAALFDLLSALLDSWSLFARVGGDPPRAREWRIQYLKRTYARGAYQPYEQLVIDAARDVGFAPALADELLRRWDELEPWPDVPDMLRALRGCRAGIVTNCSEALAARAVARLKHPFAVVVTAERAGWYKPHAEPYQLALQELGVPADRVLYVAGSPGDVLGATDAGMAVFWHNRAGLEHAEATKRALETATSLKRVPELLGR